MSTSRKLALTGVFLLGLFDIIVGIVRVITVESVSYKDQSYDEEPSVEWIRAETSIAIIVACLPICPSILRKALPRSMRSFHKRSRDSSKDRREIHPSHDDQLQLVESAWPHTSKVSTSGLNGSARSDSDVEALSNGALSLQKPDDNVVHVT